MIRSVEQYLESLRDGRVLYHQGERVKDVTTHPVLRRVVQYGAMDYVLTNDPEVSKTFVAKNDDGEDVHFLWLPPRNADDLVKRREVFIEGIRRGGISLHCMGVDGMAACTVLAARVDAALGTDYTSRVEAYRKYVQQNDLGLTTAQTDIKGDRGLRPSKQVQHQDFYVRVVRASWSGAASTTSAPPPRPTRPSCCPAGPTRRTTRTTAWSLPRRSTPRASP
jgi:4-hydroxybutyryl-CoA dehydratase/vinylacetyl-CoA-Delta-isomerase